MRSVKRGYIRGFSKTPDASTEQGTFHFQHGQQGPKVAYPKHEADKLIHSSSSIPQENFMLKFDIDKINSYLQSYVSTI